MAYLTRYDHPFIKQFHALPQSQSTAACHPRSQFLGLINCADNCNSGLKCNRVSGLTLTLKGCFDDSRSSCERRPRVFVPQSARNLEVISLGEAAKDTKLEKDPTLSANGRGTCGRGSPLGFLDRSDKIAVAVDVDEVLGNFLSALNRFIADRYSLNHSVSEYYVYEFFKIWNCSRNEADIRVHEFFKTPYFKKGIQPIPGAREALLNLSRFCNLSVVTSRQNVIKDHTIAWIEKHYPRLFQEIHFGNHFALDGRSRPKSEICRSLGAKVLIDDNPRYAIECAEVGIRVLLFDYQNSYPWSKMETINQHPLVTKVCNWDEVQQHIVSWIIS
ncbi:hypothetical protein SLEP1_g15987 [Rubroshorea leprosula]|uniref:Tac7077 n=2 Tax=Rubroshorea leprosula TaxID=152421 RepID=A0AAV5IYM1_9ROSI|nr:hypothetical protein SLEP1_g15987 [Rubroshorea leprosula]